MPMLIVDALEVVDIEHDHRQRPCSAVEPDHLGLEAILEVASVVNPGEGIGDGQRAQFLFYPLEIGNIRHVAMPQRTAAG